MSWKDCMLGDVITLKRGHDLPEKNRQPGNVPVVSSSGITGYHNAPKAEPPGVVTGRYGTLGEVFFVEEPFWPLNTALYVIDFKENDPRFVAYLLRNTLRNYQSEKAAVPGVNRNVLHTLPVRVPGLADQTAIAGILSAYDDLIENNRRRIELLEESARLLYREWFVHFRFPGHGYVEMIDGIPAGWKYKTLGEIAETNNSNYQAKDLPDEIDYIDISSVAQGQIVAKKHTLASDAPNRARRKINDGDVIWSNVRPNLRAYALALEPGEFDVVSTGFTVLTPSKVPFSWLYLSTTTDNFVSYLANHATGAGYPAVRPDDFERAKLLMPSRPLLVHFHQAIEPNFRLIRKLSEQNQELAQARNLLLPRLMNGKITV